MAQKERDNAVEHIISVHITATPSKAEDVMDTITWMLTSPNEDDDTWGIPGVVFEGMFIEEYKEDADS